MSIFQKELGDQKPRTKTQTTIVNEIGNTIKVSTEIQRPSHKRYTEIRIVAEGPHSVSDNTWTLKEAQVIHAQLGQILTSAR
jgi:hypothetical protein